MAHTRDSSNDDDPLPLASLRLLAPPLRLVSAALWKVMQQRDVMQFGKLEEFVTKVLETVPGLLSHRHLAKLTLGLQAKLILEHVRLSPSPDSELIISMLDRVRAPTLSKGEKQDEKINMSVKNFHTFVNSLLKNPAERQRFFQEEFNSQYGSKYDSALEKLLWEFLMRLDQLLPVPDLTQTVSWLTDAPAVIEEYARCASQPQLLRTLLQYEKCLGHPDSAASVPSSTGDSILSALSLPPSGKIQDTNQSKSTQGLKIVLSRISREEWSSSGQTSKTESQVASVIGTMSSEDIPLKTSTIQDIISMLENDSEEETAETSDSPVVGSRTSSQSDSVVNDSEDQHFGNVVVTLINQTPTSSEAENTDEASLRPLKKSVRRRSLTQTQGTSSSLSGLEQKNGRKGELEDGSKHSQKVQDITCKEGSLQGDALASCLKRQLRVVIPRLDIGKLPQQSKVRGDSVDRKRKRVVRTWIPEKDLTSTVENQSPTGSPCIPAAKVARMDKIDRSEKDSLVTESTSDVILDSEDEAVEKVKVKLFTTRYCKTKNNTYIPTLHEFWSPAFFPHDPLCKVNGHR